MQTKNKNKMKASLRERLDFITRSHKELDSFKLDKTNEDYTYELILQFSSKKISQTVRKYWIKEMEKELEKEGYEVETLQPGEEVNTIQRIYYWLPETQETRKTLTVKKGDRVKLEDGIEGKIVRYPANTAIVVEVERDDQKTYNLTINKNQILEVL